MVDLAQLLGDRVKVGDKRFTREVILRGLQEEVLAVRLHGASQRTSAGAHRHLTGTILTDHCALVPTLLGIGKDAVSALGNLRNGKMLNGKER